MKRDELKKKISKENQLGKRIKWAREKIKVGFRDIEKALGIPESNIRSIENGGRTTVYEDLKLLAEYFTLELSKRFKDYAPIYKGEEIDEITVLWLMYGSDDAKKMYKKTIEAIREDFREREMELIERNFALDQELTMIRREAMRESQGKSEY